MFYKILYIVLILYTITFPYLAQVVYQILRYNCIRRYMAEILAIRRKIPYNQSINRLKSPMDPPPEIVTKRRIKQAANVSSKLNCA